MKNDLDPESESSNPRSNQNHKSNLIQIYAQLLVMLHAVVQIELSLNQLITHTLLHWWQCVSQVLLAPQKWYPVTHLRLYLHGGFSLCTHIEPLLLLLATAV